MELELGLWFTMGEERSRGAIYTQKEQYEKCREEEESSTSLKSHNKKKRCLKIYDGGGLPDTV